MNIIGFHATDPDRIAASDHGPGADAAASGPQTRCDAGRGTGRCGARQRAGARRPARTVCGASGRCGGADGLLRRSCALHFRRCGQDRLDPPGLFGKRGRSFVHAGARGAGARSGPYHPCAGAAARGRVARGAGGGALRGAGRGPDRTLGHAREPRSDGDAPACACSRSIGHDAAPHAASRRAGSERCADTLAGCGGAVLCAGRQCAGQAGFRHHLVAQPRRRVRSALASGVES